MSEVLKGYKLPVITWVSSRDLMYNMVTILNNTVLYNGKLLRKQILNVLSTHTHKKF